MNNGACGETAFIRIMNGRCNLPSFFLFVLFFLFFLAERICMGGIDAQTFRR